MQITAQVREKIGKSSKSLKYNRQLPAVLFGKHLESIPVTVSYENFSKVYTGAGETALIDFDLGEDKSKVLIKDVQVDPVTGTYVHAGFYKVNLKEKITADIPVKVTGEEASPILKSGEGILLTLLSEIAIECLPADLPAEFTVDVSGFTEIDQSVAVKDLVFDREKIELVDVTEDELVLKVDYAQMPEEEEAVVDEAEALQNIEATAEKPADEEADGDASPDKKE